MDGGREGGRCSLCGCLLEKLVYIQIVVIKLAIRAPKNSKEPPRCVRRGVRTPSIIPDPAPATVPPIPGRVRGRGRGNGGAAVACAPDFVCFVFTVLQFHLLKTQNRRIVVER